MLIVLLSLETRSQGFYSTFFDLSWSYCTTCVHKLCNKCATKRSSGVWNYGLYVVFSSVSCPVRGWYRTIQINR